MSYTPAAIVELIKAHHTDDPYDGDSIVYFKSGTNLEPVKNLLLQDSWFAKYWKCEEIVNGFVFTDQDESGCFLTSSKEYFESMPDWVGLKIQTY